MNEEKEPRGEYVPDFYEDGPEPMQQLPDTAEDPSEMQQLPFPDAEELRGALERLDERELP